VQLALMAILALLANWVRVYTVIEPAISPTCTSYLVSVEPLLFGWACSRWLWSSFRAHHAVRAARACSRSAFATRCPRPTCAAGRARCHGPGAGRTAAVSWGLRTLQPAPVLSAALPQVRAAPWSSRPLTRFLPGGRLSLGRIRNNRARIPTPPATSWKCSGWPTASAPGSGAGRLGQHAHRQATESSLRGSRRHRDRRVPGDRGC